jgi:hypothetical protein
MFSLPSYCVRMSTFKESTLDPVTLLGLCILILCTYFGLDETNLLSRLNYHAYGEIV